MSFSFRSAQSGRTFIKICGISNLEDAQLCSELGIDAVGMILEKSGVARKPHSDRLSAEEATKLVASLPAHLLPFLLVHAVDSDTLLHLSEQIKPAVLQVQAPIPALDLQKVKTRRPHLGIVKSFSVTPDITTDILLNEIQTYWEHGVLDAVLLDSARGGSGHVHNWSISAELVRRLPQVPILLAGGLTATNVREALHQVRPWGIDVMSGVTAMTRDKKDKVKLRAFVHAVRTEEAPNE